MYAACAGTESAKTPGRRKKKSTILEDVESKLTKIFARTLRCARGRSIQIRTKPTNHKIQNEETSKTKPRSHAKQSRTRTISNEQISEQKHDTPPLPL